MSRWTRHGATVSLPTPRAPLDDTITVRPDTTTRHLCAGAHRSAVFADEIIAEALVEPDRAVPPCPGADAAAVLGDAVAARTRRRIRDAVVVALLVAFAVLYPVASLLSLAGTFLIARRLRKVGDDDAQRRLRTAAPVAVLPAGTGAVLLCTVDAWWLGSAWPVPAAVLVSAVMVVLAADTVLVLVLVRYRFTPDRFTADGRAARSRWERVVRGLGRRHFAEGLSRIGSADEDHGRSADVLVHRGFHPFVGAGTLLRPISITRPLEPSPDHDPATVQPVEASVLHESAAAAVRAMARTRSLSSGEGMGQLRHREQVVIHAARLVAHQGAWPGPSILPDVGGPPARHLPIEQARQLADRPVEWARYYGCFVVESWGGELATSSYLYATTDSKMIYLTLTHCVLPPIKQYFRDIDYTMPAGYGAVSAAATEFLTLPLTVVGRIRSAYGRFPRRRYRVREVDPDRFGAAMSVRQVAAGSVYQYDNQKADVDQYLHLVTSTVLRAVTEYLAECGYDIVEFEKAAMAATVVNNVNVTGGHHIGGNYVAGVNAGTTSVTRPPVGTAVDPSETGQ